MALTILSCLEAHVQYVLNLRAAGKRICSVTQQWKFSHPNSDARLET